MLARGSEDVRDDIVSINTINQPRTIVVDKPAGHLRPVLGVLAVVFLQAPGEMQKAGVTFWTQQGCTPTPRSPLPHVAPRSLTNDGNAKADILGEQPTYLVTVSWWPFTTIVASVFVGSEPGWGSDTL